MLATPGRERAVVVWAFRRRLLSTYPTTAVDPVSHTAADDTLREVEYALPHMELNPRGHRYGIS